MPTTHLIAVAALCLLLLALPARGETPYAPWAHGPPNDPAYFPVGVWAQAPRNIEAYQELGVNLYVSLHGGPTEEQLTALRDAEMHAITALNDYARSLLAEESELLDVVVAWMHRDEPDNAQAAAGGGYGPPVATDEIQRLGDEWREIDPTRPVYLNLGWAVGWDGWYGRGVRTNHPEDYPEYIKGTDIVSFDIYPGSMEPGSAISDEHWRVAWGTQRLRDWAEPEQIVWTILECSAISSHGQVSPTELRAQVWMSIIHGATGIVWFTHVFDEDGYVTDSAILRDEELRPVVHEVNHRLHELAPVINSPSVSDRLTVEIVDGEADDAIRRERSIEPVAAMLKEYDGAMYLFAVRMRDSEATARFTIDGLEGEHVAELIGDEGDVALEAGQFEQRFDAWGTRLYRIAVE